MRTTAYDDEATGTTQGDTLEVNVWRGASLLASGLDVTSWTLGWDAGRQVQGQASFTVADPDGRLAPWAMSDALAPGGSRLQVTWVSGLSGLRIPLGRWRIRRALPSESWRLVTPPAGSTSVLRLSGGGQVQISADEETSTVVLSRLDAEVVKGATVLAEVTRLLSGICTVKALPGVSDASPPAGMVYSESRMDAVEDLLAVIGATHRMAGDGTMEVVSVDGVGPVWTLAGGPDGVLVDLTRALSDDNTYNGVTSNNETTSGAPLIGRAYLNFGPLAWGGPFGKVPMFHQAVAVTATGVQADAVATLASRQTSGEVDLAVTCLTHPGLQMHDRVTILAATTVGDAAITGRVVGMTLASTSSGGGITPTKAMALTVRVSTNDLEAIAFRVRRG